MRRHAPGPATVLATTPASTVAESFVETAYAITEAISTRALPEEEST